MPERRQSMYSFGILGASADINRKDRWGRTPLVAAIEANNKPLIRSLLALGADVNAKTTENATTLHFAISRVRRNSPRSRLCFIRMLLRRRAKLNTLDKYGQSPLMDAILSSNADLVRMLLRRGANPDMAFGQATLVSSMYHGNCDRTKWELIEAGVRIDEPDEEGETPLICAAQRDERLVRELLRRGADSNAADHQGTTPLMNAASGGNPGIVQMLLDAGADVNARNHGGANPLMHAAWWSNDKETLSLLIAAGTDVTATDSEGRTVIDYANTYYHDPAIIATLKAAGAMEKKK
ncbi:MAG TPA: ankyrin repeat domain-containing protein [Capsulimonadaceae bacterium]|nr:ankyrin repeat domain-containing protein [Capsulimonadaceae bacterium]